ncbi:MAG: hypothetical protein ACFFD2_07670 [Promethearchaeota archaeon]
MSLLLWAELLILQTLIGYCFVIANDCIGLYNIRDLSNMKGDITLVKAHKWIGRVETVFFYAITIQCLLMILPWKSVYLDITSTVGIHFMIGGIIANCLFGFKFVIATFKKNLIYKYGQFIGPIGFIGWSLGHWTSLINYYFNVVPNMSPEIHVIPSSFLFAAILPIPIGISIFLAVLIRRGSKAGKKRFSVHQIAFILHGITFGYEGAARDLLGTPALFKYVVPKTYEFLEKMMYLMGFDMKKLEKMNLNEAMDAFMKTAAKIGMAEKIKVKWESDRTFIVESINCSTSKVRSTMKEEELTNAICPWAIIAAAIVNKITGKNLEIEPSEFHEIGAKNRLTIID